MQIIPVTEVHIWDGGERHNFGFYLERNAHSDAELKVAEPHCNIFHCDLVIFSNLAEVKENTRLELRRSAWRALTVPQRQALGLPARLEDVK